MSFKITKIKKRGFVFKLKKYLKHKFHRSQNKKKYIVALIGFLIIGGGMQAFYKAHFQDFVFKSLTNQLPTDSQGFTNLLIVGMGGAGHDGTDLTDTIILAGINPKQSKAYLLSIPRDLYINHPEIIPQRVNSIYANYVGKLKPHGAFSLLNKAISNITDIDIHYHIGVNFEAVTDIVDALGGVDIYNENLIYDPFYPGPNYTFDTFTLPAGAVKLNGETALKFIRSRKTTSDFDRSRRQQQLISALKDKAQSKEVLTSPNKLKQLYSALMSNIVTNMSLDDMIYLASTAKNFDMSKIVNLVIHDDPTRKGGFLFVPPKSEYQDAFVLLPLDPKYSYIQNFIQLHRKYTNTMLYHGKVIVKNGTDIPGYARKVAAHLTRLGFQIEDVTNASSTAIEKSELQYYNLTQQKVLEAFEQALFIKNSSELPINNPDVTIHTDIIIGEDLKAFYDYFTPIEKLEELILQGQKEWYQSPLKNTSSEATLEVQKTQKSPLIITSKDTE